MSSQPETGFWRRSAIYRRWRRLADRLREKRHKRAEKRRYLRRVVESMAANDTAVLGALTYLVEATRGEQERQERRHAELFDLFDRVTAQPGAQEPVESRRTGGLRRPAGTPGTVVRTARYRLLNPEIDLLAHLAPRIQPRIAVDVGANTGEVSAALLALDFQVHAFEPYAPVYEELCRRLKDRPGFVPHAVAVGPSDGELVLHVPVARPGSAWGEASQYCSLVDHALPAGELNAGRAIPVPVRSLDSLHRTGEVPAEVGLVKIDTEGFDLEVVRGMGEHAYALVMAEFWDQDFVLARSGAVHRLDDLVAEMRRRGYPWHLALVRTEEAGVVHYVANLSTSVERSWGNVLFFRESSLFEQARSWCAATLPQALFTPGPGSAPDAGARSGP